MQSNLGLFYLVHVLPGGWWVFKILTLDSLEAVFFFNSFNTEKWLFGASIYVLLMAASNRPFLAKMGGDFTPPFLIILSLSSIHSTTFTVD